MGYFNLKSDITPTPSPKTSVPILNVSSSKLSLSFPNNNPAVSNITKPNLYTYPHSPNAFPFVYHGSISINSISELYPNPTIILLYCPSKVIVPLETVKGGCFPPSPNT